MPKKNAPYLTIAASRVIISFETRSRLYDMSISPGGVKFLVNSRQVPQFPMTAGARQVLALHLKTQDAIRAYLASPSNDNWWALKRMG